MLSIKKDYIVSLSGELKINKCALADPILSWIQSVQKGNESVVKLQYSVCAGFN